MILSDEIRRELALLARRPTARVTQSIPKRPTIWCPTEVRTPKDSPFDFFTDAGAWEFIAAKLDEGHPVEVITLEKPADKTAYVMKICLQAGSPLLYVKLQLGSGKIYGRSFHLSNYA